MILKQFNASDMLILTHLSDLGILSDEEPIEKFIPRWESNPGVDSELKQDYIVPQRRNFMSWFRWKLTKLSGHIYFDNLLIYFL